MPPYFEDNNQLMRRCPFCAEDIQDLAVKCKHCSEWLGPPGVPSPAPSPQTPGAATNDLPMAPLPRRDVPVSTPPPTKRSGLSGKAWVGIGMATILVLGLVGQAMSDPSGGTTSSDLASNGLAVPGVVGSPLDGARAAAQAAGFTVEVTGGGIFGVVKESNWVVCSQSPGVRDDAPGTIMTLHVKRDCISGANESSDNGGSDVGGGGGSSGGSSNGGVGETSGGSSNGGGGGVSSLVKVPNVVGMDLQSAQDTLQAFGFYNLGSHDVTGESSFQILDRDWIVVDQTPAPGDAASRSRLVELGVVHR
jgi:hypothetical protein